MSEYSGDRLITWLPNNYVRQQYVSDSIALVIRMLREFDERMSKEVYVDGK